MPCYIKHKVLASFILCLQCFFIYMPYSGIDDKNLPTNVKGLSVNKRKRWVSTFNSIVTQCRKRGKDCEDKAFRIANAGVKESNLRGLIWKT